MTPEQYKMEIDNLKLDYDKACADVMRRFALANSPHNLGDVITDHQHTIKIEAIRVARSYGQSLPECVFTGPVLNKDGSARKGNVQHSVYQCNIKVSQ